MGPYFLDLHSDYIQSFGEMIICGGAHNNWHYYKGATAVGFQGMFTQSAYTSISGFNGSPAMR